MSTDYSNPLLHLNDQDGTYPPSWYAATAVGMPQAKPYKVTINVTLPWWGEDSLDYLRRCILLNEATQ